MKRVCSQAVVTGTNSFSFHPKSFLSKGLVFRGAFVFVVSDVCTALI